MAEVGPAQRPHGKHCSSVPLLLVRVLRLMVPQIGNPAADRFPTG